MVHGLQSGSVFFYRTSPRCGFIRRCGAFRHLFDLVFLCFDKRDAAVSVEQTDLTYGACFPGLSRTCTAAPAARSDEAGNQRIRGTQKFSKLGLARCNAFPYISFLRDGKPERNECTLGCRLMAGQRILVPSMGVRLPPSQPLHLHMARSSSGSGRRPLKAEITSSNLVRATKCFQALAREPVLLSTACGVMPVCRPLAAVSAVRSRYNERAVLSE